jgi:hypothetical protein
MFSNKKRPLYCKFVKPNKIEVYKGRDTEDNPITENYDLVSGIVQDITVRENEFQGATIKKWTVKISGKGGQEAILQLGYSSGFTRGFFNSLLSADLSKEVDFGCYTKFGNNGEFLCPSISQGGLYLRWGREDMPKVEWTKVGTKDVADDTRAVGWTEKIVEELLEKIGKVPEGDFLETAKEDFENDLPF